MDVTRIIDLPSKTYIEEGDYIAIDNQQDGTQKVQFTNLFDSSLSQSNKIAPANTVGQQFTNTNTEINALRASVGSPLKASTVAQMTDTNKIYVYTGSETGYTAGNWYYYNGTAWVSGGVYNSVAVVTDPTLTLSGVPADAKATGDEIGDLDASAEYKTMLNGYLNGSGQFVSASGWKATDFIPFSASKLHGKFYAVAMESASLNNVWAYDKNKDVISPVCRYTTSQAVDDEFDLPSGTEYIRFMIGEYSYNLHPDFSFNYIVGDVLVENMPIVKQAQALSITNEAKVDGLIEILDVFTNIADPTKLITGGVWSGIDTVYEAANWCRQEIRVEENKEYTIDACTEAFSWFTNDSLQNLGHITSARFTTPSGCTKIRVGKSGTNPFVLLDTDYSGTVNTTLFPYGVYKAKDTAINEPTNLTSVSVFQSMGVIGDSYSSGGMYGVSGVTDGSHYNVCWGAILGRRCGVETSIYAKGALDVSHWLSDVDRGLPKLESDPARDLYVIVLGINEEKTLADPSVTASTGTVADIDLENPSNNADTFCGHYGRMVSAILAHAPNSKIILVMPTMGADRRTQIPNIATKFGLPYISMLDDLYYSTDFYNNSLVTAHPIAMSYAGMALAFERQIAECIVNNAIYFKTVQ